MSCDNNKKTSENAIREKDVMKMKEHKGLKTEQRCEVKRVNKMNV